MAADLSMFLCQMLMALSAGRGSRACRQRKEKMEIAGGRVVGNFDSSAAEFSLGGAIFSSSLASPHVDQALPIHPLLRWYSRKKCMGRMYTHT